MQVNTCAHTNELMQKLNNGSMGPADLKHLESCQDCREAMEIRKAFLEKIPKVIPDRKELVWRRFTVHKILQREQRQTNWQMSLSFALEVIVVVILAIVLFIVSRITPGLAASLSGNKILSRLNELWEHPVMWMSFILVAFAGYFFLRFLKLKTK